MEPDGNLRIVLEKDIFEAGTEFPTITIPFVEMEWWERLEDGILIRFRGGRFGFYPIRNVMYVEWQCNSQEYLLHMQGRAVESVAGGVVRSAGDWRTE